MNPYGEVTTESYGDVVTVNGHSYAEAKTPLHQLRGAREPALHRAVPRPDHLRPLDRQAREPARRRHPRAAPRRPEGRPALDARAHRAVARRADARRTRPPATSRRCCRTGTSPTSSSSSRRWTRSRPASRPQHAALRRRGEVLLLAPSGRRRDAARRSRASTRSVTAPASRAGSCRPARAAWSRRVRFSA